MECGSLVLPPERLDAIFDRIERIEQVANIRDFTGLLTERALTTA
jgi:hypothetical protein